MSVCAQWVKQTCRHCHQKKVASFCFLVSMLNFVFVCFDTLINPTTSDFDNLKSNRSDVSTNEQWESFCFNKENYNRFACKNSIFSLHLPFAVSFTLLCVCISVWVCVCDIQTVNHLKQGNRLSSPLVFSISIEFQRKNRISPTLFILQLSRHEKETEPNQTLIVLVTRKSHEINNSHLLQVFQ